MAQLLGSPWHIQRPSTPLTPGTQACLTITGPPSAGKPEVEVSFNGRRAVAITDIDPEGGGVYVVCFAVPSGTKATTVTAGKGGTHTVLGL